MKTAVRIIFIALASLVVAQENIEIQIQGNRKELDRVRDEINNLQREIAKTNIKASSTLEQIKVMDREISLLNKSKKLLTKKSRLLSNNIDLTRSQLNISRRKLQILKNQYAKRAVHIYKYGKIQNLDLLVNAGSINQALVRYKYLKYFNDQEKQVINKIKSEIEDVQNLESSLSLDYQNQRNSIREKEQKQQRYLSRKNDKKLMVNRLKWNSQNLSTQLKSAEEEYQKLYQLIVALEKQRRIREQRGETKQEYALNLKDFKKKKGKLPWPVKGNILNKYGKQYNPKLKTTINNTGIDIKARTGAEVRSVFVGLVSMITYLSGFGNTVILDHGEGYYTVYSHLDEFFVEPDELVVSGHVIGQVGDSGSLEGSKLHFAVFANQKAENPQLWLR